MRNAHVAAEISIRGKDACLTVRIDTGLTKRSVRTDGRAFIRALEIAISVADSQNIEWAAGTDLKDRCKREIRKYSLPCLAMSPIRRRLKHSAEHEPVTLVKQRVGTLS